MSGNDGEELKADARVRLYRRLKCHDRRWYTRMTIRYGRGYEKLYTRYAPIPICGRYPPGPQD